MTGRPPGPLTGNQSGALANRPTGAPAGRRPGALAGVLLIAVLLAACASDDADSSAPTTTTTEVPTPRAPATTLAPPDLPALPEAAEPADQAAPAGTNGIAVAGDGTLWIADGLGDQVLSVDADSGEILSRWPTPGGAFPDDVALDSDGRVFWTGFQSGQIGRIDPATGDHRQIAELPAGANPLTFTQDGRMLVGLAIIDDGLYELDPEGRDEPRLLNEELGDVNGFDVARDGQLYGPRSNGELVRIDFESGVVLAVVAEGLGFGTAVTEGPDESLWHLSTLPEPLLRRIDRISGAVGEVIELDTDAVDNVAVDDDGTIYVTTFNTPVVLVIEPDGTTRELTVGGER